jgi:N-acetylmuramoyl-L-alanine amidase
MALKIQLNYSPNFDSKKRNSKQIKFLIFHYTGMKKESRAIKKLTNIQSEVSSHYFIKNNGTLLLLVPELYIAWHAGKSGWKNKKFLNKSSIGIEISNPGHRYGYKKFNKKQIQILINLLKKLINKFKISPKNILGHSDIAPDRKKDPGEKFPWKTLARKKVSIWHKINPKILSKLRNQKCSKKDNISFVYNLKKIGYSKCPEKYLVKAFQMRFRPELINGKIDKECLEISKSIVKT